MSILHYFYYPRAVRTLQDCLDNNEEIAKFLLVSYVCACYYILELYIRMYSVHTCPKVLYIHGLHTDLMDHSLSKLPYTLVWLNNVTHSYPT